MDKPSVAEFVGETLTNGVPATWSWHMALPGAADGDCGGVLLTETGTFLGMLTAVSGEGAAARAAYQGFCERDYAQAREFLGAVVPVNEASQDDAAPFKNAGFPMTFGPLAFRSFLRKIPPGWRINGEVLGTVSPYHGAKNQSPMQKTMFHEAVATAFGLDYLGKWAPPHDKACEFDGVRMDPFDRMVADWSTQDDSGLSVSRFDETCDVMAEWIASRIPAPSETFRAPLSACLDGDALMKRVNVDSSSGFPGGGNKSEFLDITYGEDGVRHATLDAQSQLMWDELSVAYKQKDLIPMHVRVFLKLNEVRSVEKIARAGTRTINCVAYPLNLKLKSVFGRLTGYLQRYKEITGVQIGLNMGSRELCQVIAAAWGSNPGRWADAVAWADWDTKHQDLSLTRTHILGAFRVMIGIAVLLGADESLRDEMWFWAQVAAEPIAIMKGGDAVRKAWNSSGVQLTTEVNSYGAKALYTQSIAEELGKQSLAFVVAAEQDTEGWTHRSGWAMLVRFVFRKFGLLVYGDDVLMCSPDPLWRVAGSDLVARMLVNGLIITPGDKTKDVDDQLRCLEDCSFLKRRIKWRSITEAAQYSIPLEDEDAHNAGSEVLTAALELDSIVKSLMWYEPSTKINVRLTATQAAGVGAPLPKVQQHCEILSNAQFEFWMYGARAFQGYTERLKMVAETVGIAHLVQWRTYEEIYRMYYMGEYTTMSL